MYFPRKGLIGKNGSERPRKQIFFQDGKLHPWLAVSDFIISAIRVETMNWQVGWVGHFAQK
jgi:hypothetical protein